MSFISTTTPEQASGEVAALFQQLRGNLDYLPNYARVFSHRPELMADISRLQQGLKKHMQPRLWNLVNLATALAINGSYCALAFARRLLRGGISEAELLEIVLDGDSGLLSVRERRAMQFAAKVAVDSSQINCEDIAALQRSGFADPEIFDLAAAAAWRCFFGKVPDALGAAPERALRPRDKALLEQLLVGRKLAPEPQGAAKIHQSYAQSS